MVTCVVAGPSHAGNLYFKAPKGDTSCHQQAVRDLELFSPRGAQVFHALTDRSMFWPFLTCDNIALGLSTAVHEGVHGLTEQLDGYPLVHGGVLKRPHEVERFVAPKVIARRFPRDNIFVQNYLVAGAASSADTLLFLFDELNAYTHDLHTSIRIRTLPGGDTEVDHRDGLASLMRFLMHYADEARVNYPDTWRGLQTPKVRNVVRTLWTQAEKTLASACGIPRFGGEDHRYVAEMCDPAKSAALGDLLGRRVACHRRCLYKPDDAAGPQFEIADASGASSMHGADMRGSDGREPVGRETSPQDAEPRGPAVARPSTSRPPRRPTRWPVVVTRTEPVQVAATPGDATPARFASPALLVPRLLAAPILVRNIE